jgi:rhodanese-related sulfurtransferase
MTNIRYINANELKELYGSSNLIICDIREADEYNREHIIGAKNTPLSTFDINEINGYSKNKTVVFHCQSGNRTKQNENLLKNIDANEVLVLCDGITDWKKNGCAVAKNNKAPLPLMRQVQIIAGSIVVLGAILSLTISSGFILLSAFVGAGLMLAGITGFCGMANLLMLLPYNKNNNCNSSCSN